MRKVLRSTRNSDQLVPYTFQSIGNTLPPVVAVFRSSFLYSTASFANFCFLVPIIGCRCGLMLNSAALIQSQIPTAHHLQMIHRPLLLSIRLLMANPTILSRTLILRLELTCLLSSLPAYSLLLSFVPSNSS